MNKSIALAALVSLFLTACSTVSSNNTNVDLSKANPANNETNLAAAAYAKDTRSAPQDLVIASTNNACMDGFSFLKELDKAKYTHYYSDYNKIFQNYKFLNTNKEIMDQDSKVLLTMAINKKLDTLCNKVQYDAFVAVKSRLVTLTDI